MRAIVIGIGRDESGRARAARHRRSAARQEVALSGSVRGCGPTPDRVRETLFNWLQPRLAGRALSRPVRGQRRARHRGAVARRGAGRPSARRMRAAVTALRETLDAVRSRRRSDDRGDVRGRRARLRCRRARSTSCSSIRRSTPGCSGPAAALLERPGLAGAGGAGSTWRPPAREALAALPQAGWRTGRGRPARSGIICSGVQEDYA